MRFIMALPHSRKYKTVLDEKNKSLVRHQFRKIRHVRALISVHTSRRLFRGALRPSGNTAALHNTAIFSLFKAPPPHFPMSPSLSLCDFAALEHYVNMCIAILRGTQ